jgi:nicotinamidase-related amidase
MMNRTYTLSKKTSGVLLIDVQEKLLPRVEHSCLLMKNLQKAVRGFRILNLPIYVTEQYPRGLGETVPSLKSCLGPTQIYFSKTSFSCMGDSGVQSSILETSLQQWILMGLEAHVCVLQTARALINAGKEVVILNDAISSRSIYDFSTAIAEMRDMGARISSTESVLFELLQDAKAPEFKQISQLLK